MEIPSALTQKIHRCNSGFHCFLPNNDLPWALTCLLYMTER